MIKWIKAKIAAAKAWHAAEEYHLGYCEAAGCLISGGKNAAEAMDGLCVTAPTSYSRGVFDAIDDFNARLKEANK